MANERTAAEQAERWELASRDPAYRWLRPGFWRDDRLAAMTLAEKRAFIEELLAARYSQWRGQHG